MWRPPTLDEIRQAFLSLVIAAVKDDENVYMAASNQDSDPELKKLILVCSFTPGEVKRCELGGHGALGERHGIWRMTISALHDDDANRAWELADLLESLFVLYTIDGLSVTDDENDEIIPVYCEFPYTQNVGQLPDNRNGITVTVPWWTRVMN